MRTTVAKRSGKSARKKEGRAWWGGGEARRQSRSRIRWKRTGERVWAEDGRGERRRVEGGEGPAREFPAFAQPHIDPTPVNSPHPTTTTGLEGRGGERGGGVCRRAGQGRKEVGGLSAYTQYEGEDGVENQRNLGGLLRVVQREKTPVCRRFVRRRVLALLSTLFIFVIASCIIIN